MDNENLIDLFTNKEYEIQIFEYKEIKEEIKCLKSSSTDFDLTGQIIWEAAIQLANLIVDNKEDFKNKNVIELGAGAGLTGIVCANFAKNVILTDNNEIVVELLEENKQFQKKDNIQVKLFEWGQQQAQEFITKFGEIDYIIGSDIMHWPASIKPLAQTFRVYLDAFPKLQILIALQKRSKFTVEAFDKELEELNLTKQLIKTIELVFIYKIENKQK